MLKLCPRGQGHRAFSHPLKVYSLSLGTAEFKDHPLGPHTSTFESRLCGFTWPPPPLSLGFLCKWYHDSTHFESSLKDALSNRLKCTHVSKPVLRSCEHELGDREGSETGRCVSFYRKAGWAPHLFSRVLIQPLVPLRPPLLPPPEPASPSPC